MKLAQSALEPAGHGAERIDTLFWWMAIGGGVIWLIMTALIIYAAYHRRETLSRGKALMLIIGGGVIFPTTVLTLLLWYGLTLLPKLLAPAPHGGLQIYVSGEQWWWRIRYLHTHGVPIELANEIRLPVGEPVDFLLESPDVIHSFWIPALGGKMDMIPGRQNRLTLQATVTGSFRGVCAEYCGTSHAWMEFPVIVMEKADFTRWLNGQTLPSHTPENPHAQHGRDLFLYYGCGACHTIRGTEADGIIGPDLTHVGSRLSLGAGVLGNDTQDFIRWISETNTLKPDVHMPAFGMLPANELQAMATYLESLQ